MSSNTASSSVGVAGSANSTTPRRNSKKPKCNFFSKDLIFMDFFFGGVLVSTHLLIFWVFTWVLLERWEYESEAWAWEWVVSLRGERRAWKAKKKQKTQHFRVQIRPVRMRRKKNVGEAWDWRAWYSERQREWAWLLKLSESEAERARQRGESLRCQMRHERHENWDESVRVLGLRT